MRVQVEVWLHTDAQTHVATCATSLLHLEQSQCSLGTKGQVRVASRHVKDQNTIFAWLNAQLDHLTICVSSISVTSSFLQPHELDNKEKYL